MERLILISGLIVYLQALIESSESNLEDETGVRLVALFDHEEVGSDSAQGAGSPAMLNTLSRITNSFTADSKVVNLGCPFNCMVFSPYWICFDTERIVSCCISLVI